MQEKYFCGDNVIDDVTGWPQIQLYIFPYEWNMHILHGN